MPNEETTNYEPDWSAGMGSVPQLASCYISVVQETGPSRESTVPGLFSRFARLLPSTVGAAKLRQAREQFSELLSRPNTREAVWQTFFAEHPYVLSTALPVKISPEDIVPLGRPGRSEPDLIFYPHRKPHEHPSYGVIELKRPTDRILTQRRKNLVTLSATAATAVAQGHRYLADLESGRLLELDERVLFLGNCNYVFIVMGLSSELQAVLVNDLLRESSGTLLPPNFQILPYDFLYRSFAASVPPVVMCALPAVIVDLADLETFLLHHAPDSAFFGRRRDENTVGMLAALCPPEKLASLPHEVIIAKLNEIQYDYKPSTPSDDDTHWGAYGPFDGQYYWFASTIGAGFPRSPVQVGLRPNLFDED